MGMLGNLEISGGSDVSQSNLDDLADVVITTPADGEVLTYDSATGTWVNETAGLNYAKVATRVAMRF